MGGVLAVLFAAGCQQGGANRVVEVLPDPLLRPSHRPAPPKQPPTPEKPRVARGPHDGWVPAGGISKRWQCIVIHHSANDRDTPDGMADWHVQRGWDELGYHFVIGNGVRYPDGQVHVGSRWPKQKTGAHCKVPGNYYNEHGIGICLIGNLNRHGPSARQMQALTELVAFLMVRCNIPAERVYTHGGVTRKTECPGRHFSLSEIRRRVSRESVAAYAK